MTEHLAPEWLAELEAWFGAVIRTPLDRATGTLTATPASYEPRMLEEVPNGAERLAVYNRQYWFRLFTVLQRAFPLTARLLGYFRFNDYASRFLLANPPRGWDIDGAIDGFDAFFIEALAGADVPAPREALAEAARIDAAWHDVFRAPPTHSFRPSAEDAGRLLDARLMPSPAVALIEQHWPLLELRRKLKDDTSEARVPLPSGLGRAQHWALARRQEGMGQLLLDSREAELFRLLRQCTVREALGRLEAACPAAERAALPERARAWLSRSVELDFWIGLEVR